MLFEKRGVPDFVEAASADHGRIDSYRIWCSAALNTYLDFPHVGQVFVIERESIEKKSGKRSCETALGITSQTPQKESRATGSGDQSRSLDHREHPLHHRLELRRWNRSRIRTGHGPENITRLRRFAVGILKSFQTPTQSIAEMIRKLSFRTRLVFDYLRMTKNSASATWVT